MSGKVPENWNCFMSSAGSLRPDRKAAKFRVSHNSVKCILKHNEGHSTARVTKHSTRPAGSESSGCISARSCLSAVAGKHIRCFRIWLHDCGKLDHVQLAVRWNSYSQTSCPELEKLPKCLTDLEAALPSVCGGSWSFRVCGSLPRGVAVLCDRRPMLSCI